MEKKERILDFFEQHGSKIFLLALLLVLAYAADEVILPQVVLARARNISRPTCEVFLGGSDPENITIPGPDPHIQSPNWTSVIPNDIQYPGNKLRQAISAYSNVEKWNCGAVIVVGFSAGADAAIVYASLYRTPPIKGLGIMGPTLTGLENTTDPVEKRWERTFDSLLNSGTTKVFVDIDQGSDESTSEGVSARALLDAYIPSSPENYVKDEQIPKRPHLKGDNSTAWSKDLIGRVMSFLRK